MTAPTDPSDAATASILAELNDLLAADRAAIEAYTATIGALTNLGRRETLIRFRTDHERHVTALVRVIRGLGGTPAEPAAGGPFATAMRQPRAHGDAGVMTAFEAQEADVCERYTRAATHAADWPEDVVEVLREGADDEARHYEWAAEQLAALGGAVATAERVAEAVESTASRAADRLRARVADGTDRVRRQGRRGVDAVRRSAAQAREWIPEHLPERPSNRVLAVGAISAAVAFVVTAAVGASLRRR